MIPEGKSVVVRSDDAESPSRNVVYEEGYVGDVNGLPSLVLSARNNSASSREGRDSSSLRVGRSGGE